MQRRTPPGTPLLRRFQLAIFALVAAVSATGGPLAQGTTREVLNSERIAQSFGSYGIEVLEASDALRVSNLYSTEDGERTCRTFAVALYPEAVDPAVAAEHAQIVAGGSMGAVFAAKGWTVRKSHLRYGERAATKRLSTLMGVPAGTPLAEHAYVLDVVRDGRAIEYAALVEIHHPAYLGVGQLPAIYGPTDSKAHAELLARLLVAASKASGEL